MTIRIPIDSEEFMLAKKLHKGSIGWDQLTETQKYKMYNSELDVEQFVDTEELRSYEARISGRPDGMIGRVKAVIGDITESPFRRIEQ